MFADMLRQVRRVPRGKVATYGDIAYAAGYPGAARQVAWALHGGSVGLPWHRIVGAGGTILLPGEQGFEQRMHLQAEGVGFLGLKVNMPVHHHSFFPQNSRKEKSAQIREIVVPKDKPFTFLIMFRDAKLIDPVNGFEPIAWR